MRALKDRGVEEIRQVKRRTLRTQAMGRIQPEDCAYIVKRCDEIEARITEMWEDDPERREF